MEPKPGTTPSQADAEGRPSASSLTAEGCAARRARLWGLAARRSLDAIVLTTPESLAGFANYVPSPFLFNSVGSAAALILLADRSILIGDNLLESFLARSHVDEVVTHEWYTGRRSALSRRLSLADAVLRILPSGAIRLGVEAMAAPPVPGASPVELDSSIWSIRMRKDPDELAVLRKSARAGEVAHAEALERVEPGMTELDVFSLVHQAATAATGERVLVYGDFVSGARCETERGGPPGPRVIARGDLLLLDFSVVVNGYRTDFANTFVVGDEPTPRQAELYDVCMAALEAGEGQLLRWLETRVAARDVDRAVRDVFAAHGLGGFFPSHSGHGLGLGHPECPFLVPESDDVLSGGCVIALEPGLYVPGVGGMRFERNYNLDQTRRELEVLSRHALTLRQRP